MSRQQKRRELKKQKRKQQRRQAAVELSDLQQEVDEEAVIREEEEALAKERAEHEEQERLWLLREEEAQKEWLRKQEEAEAARKRKEEERKLEGEEELEEGWEYVEDGPAEIIWQGNEIIVKKPRKKVRKGTHSSTPLAIEDKRKEGPFSNPLPPQSAAFSSHQADTPDVAKQSTNFGTEKDARNCPFYIKTGVCRFGVRCSRQHPLFNHACTLLIRAMYTGAGLALEPFESLEYTDEEVVQEYEEFYDDVHSEFIQFGEIVNFKVCRNTSPHLRGNVYVHYASQESAMAAYNHMNGRFYAKKQISCEFVGVNKWKLAICGEFMRTNYKTCSHGTACNFLHCFENPRREYEWADIDRPPPRYWQRKMAKLFGHAHVSDEEVDEERSRTRRESTHDTERGRHRDDDGRDRHSHQRRDRDDRDRKCESSDRSRRGSSKYYDRRRRSSRKRERDEDHDDVVAREKSASRKRERDVDHDDVTAREKSASRKRERDEDHDDVVAREKSASRKRERDLDHDDVIAREKSASRKRERDVDEDDVRAREKGASRDEPGCINDDRWIAGDDHLETDRHHDDDGRHSPTPDHVSHHRSHRHRSRRRSRSPSSHRARRSKTSHRARSQDGEDLERETRHRKERASKESRTRSQDGEDLERETRHRKERASKESRARSQDGEDLERETRHRKERASKESRARSQDGEDLERETRHRKERASKESRARSQDSEEHERETRHRKEKASKESKRHRRSDDERNGGDEVAGGSEHHQRSEDDKSVDLEVKVARMVSDEKAAGTKLEIPSGGLEVARLDVENLVQEAKSSTAEMGLVLDLPADDVQRSTSEWQSWRKSKKKVKLGLKEKPMRIII